MKREPALGFSKAADSAEHRFPTGTLLISIGLLIGGMRLADVLPIPSLPRISLGMTSKASAESLQKFSGSASDPALAMNANFPQKELMSERITLHDVSFKPVQVPLWAMGSRLELAAEKDQITLTDRETQQTVWKGPTQKARFSYSNISAAQTLKDSNGRVLWFDVPIPDLVFDKDENGKATLTDKNGKLLWSGHLPPSPRGTSPRSERRGTTYLMDSAGIRVSGINGYFTIIDGTGDTTRVLWSGTLPLHPVVLLRDDHRFLFWDGNRSEGGPDRTTNIRVTSEPGNVTITDARARVLGDQAVRLLKVESVLKIVSSSREIPVPQQYCVPFGNLAKSGSVLFTYKDQAGRIIRKNSVVRDGDRQHINDTGQPY